MTSLDTLVADARQGRISRRAFTTGAATFGIGAALAGSIFEAAAAPASRTGTLRASFQDGGKTLIVAIPQPTVQLDPALAGNNGYGDIIVVHDNVTEGLTRFVLGSAEIEPALAESWTASDDGLVYTFDLRAGVTFHDGTPLDADAVLTNIHRNIDPAHPLYSDQYSYSGITYAEVASAEKTGDLQVTLTLNRPITLLPGNLATFAGGLVSPAALEMGADYSQHAAGTGPFKVESFTPDVELVLVTTVKGGALPAHMPQTKRSLALIYAVNPFGADHQSHEHDPSYSPESGDEARRRMHLLGLDNQQDVLNLSEEKVRYAVIGQQFYSLLDSVSVCQFVFGPAWQLYGPDHLQQAIAAVVGWEMSVDELLEVGARKVAMK